MHFTVSKKDNKHTKYSCYGKKWHETENNVILNIYQVLYFIVIKLNMHLKTILPTKVQQNSNQCSNNAMLYKPEQYTILI